MSELGYIKLYPHTVVINREISETKIIFCSRLFISALNVGILTRGLMGTDLLLDPSSSDSSLRSPKVETFSFTL